MIGGKPARNRRSTERMLVELKQWLREISDLNAAGGVLNWDQATYMPEGGAGARGRQLAMLCRLAHERAVAPALGRLLDSLIRYGESLPYDSDDASLIRVAHREYQKKIKIPPDHIARAVAHGSASYDVWTWCPISNAHWILAGNILPTLRPISTSPTRTSTTRTRV
jgi:carboxypeptidase Taq